MRVTKIGIIALVLAVMAFGVGYTFLQDAVEVVEVSSVFDDGEVSTDPCYDDNQTFRCVRYLKAYDGDTITVEIPDVHPLLGKSASVRVRGIDTPEMQGRGPCERDTAAKAQRYTRFLLENADRIDLVNVSRDKYFRILADVMVDGESLANLLRFSGFAVIYDGGTKPKVNWCKQ